MRRRGRRRRRPGFADPRLHVGAALGRGVLALEHANCRWPGLARRYGYRFYDRLVLEEAELARVKPGHRVLQVGCGAFPFTALTLARLGCSVVGIDRSERAVVTARRIVSQEGLDSKLNIEHGHGENADGSAFDAVWVSLHVQPRDRVVSNILATMSPGSRLVLRDVGGPLRLLYRTLCPASSVVCARVQTAPSKVRRNLLTVVAEKLPSSHIPRVVLSALSTGRRGIIATTGNGHPLLEPLGIRPGRRICVRCMQRLGGSIVADLEGRRVAIDRHLAGEILVVPDSGE